MDQFIDTHCHLDFPQFDQDRDQVIRRARAGGVEFLVNIGSSLSGSVESLGLAGAYDSIYAAVGIHPHEADKFNSEMEASLREMAGKDRVVAIGETGLDYTQGYSQPENQKPLFIRQIRLAKDRDLPLVIHSRQAQVDTLKILREEKVSKAVVHCFSGDEQFLKDCLNEGFFVSFTCNITYKKADNLRQLVKLAPLERIMLETDAPYLSPEGERGRRNEPLQVKAVAAEIARIKEISIEEVACATTQNAKSFFKIK